MNAFCAVLVIFSGITGKVQGKITDSETGRPVPYANVFIANTDIGSATDENGDFFILSVAPGTYTVEVSCLGYQTTHVENVTVEIDQVARLKVNLRPSAIEIAPVTVTGEMPTIKKDYVATTYIVRNVEVTSLPVDYTPKLIAFQAAVAHTDTAMHVRGGRATEVNYMVDNVSIIDPQTGDPAINVSKGVIDEVIFLPGGFDAEYGRAMSGIINLVSANPAEKIRTQVYAKTETIMPFYYDFGYQTYQSSIHLPITQKLRGLISGDFMHTDDWDPRLYKLPHKMRDDYTLYTKWQWAASGRLKLGISGAKSRSQFERYDTRWKFNLDNYRSDFRSGDLETFHLNYLPDSRKLLNITLSRLYSHRIYGVRIDSSHGYFDDFRFKDHYDLVYPYGSNNNPFGVDVPYLPIEGDYPEYHRKNSTVYKMSAATTMQVHRIHELKAGVEYAYQDLDNFTYFTSDSVHALIDSFRYYPQEYSAYLQDNIDFEGLYAKVGCRCDYLDNDIDSIEPKLMISPRLGVSFMVTEKFLFRANIGRYTQPPLYDYMYGYFRLIPFPTYLRGDIPTVGYPDLRPEKTTSFEIGCQGEIQKNLMITVNTFYKDVSDLVGTRRIAALPTPYYQYFNIEYANIKGIELIYDFAVPLFTGKISYTLSWTKGTSSYAGEYAESTFSQPLMDYYLDFDQRHRVFVQGCLKLPLDANVFLYGYFGNGFPYTPPGPEGKFEERNIATLDFQRQLDCMLSKNIRIGHVNANINLELINIFDVRYEVTPHYPAVPLEKIVPWEYTDFYSIASSYYRPGADLNHDGLIIPYEEYYSTREFYRATDDWVNAYSAPRRARLGVSINL
jgi:outer membrane receptor protein involved in Fe transport